MLAQLRSLKESSTATSTSPLDPSKTSQKTKLGNSGSMSASQQHLLAKPFKLALMKSIASEIPACKDALSIVPLLQVLLVILQDLDGGTEDEIVVVEAVVKRLLEMMNLTVSLPTIVIIATWSMESNISTAFYTRGLIETKNGLGTKIPKWL